MLLLKQFGNCQNFQLTCALKQGYKVHFLKGPSADTIFTPFEQKQLFDLVNSSQKEDSYQIFNPQQTLSQIKNWKQQLHWINPFYAIKANPSLSQLQIMKQEELGFDCASSQEIATVLSLDVNPSKIILSNSVKKIGDIEFARANNVNLTTADTIDELHKIRAYHPNCEVLWRIAIPELHQQKLATTFSQKFGDDLLNSNDMYTRFKEIKDLGINLSGLHFHCGSGAQGSENFSFALDIAQECIKIARNLGHNMRILDLGGGFPAGAIPINLIQILQRLNNGNIEKIMAEPGRHFATNPFSVVCHIIGKRKKAGQIIYHLNDGVYHMMNCVLMDGMNIGGNNADWYAQWQNGNNEQQTTEFEDGTLVGMTCDGLDIIAKNIKLPKMNIGDAIVINSMGAYTSGPVSKFNGMKVSEKVMLWEPQLEKEQIEIIKKAQLQLCF